VDTCSPLADVNGIADWQGTELVCSGPHTSLHSERRAMSNYWHL